MKNKNTRRGFTLIELLVVVLIIGILAAVAVPQYQKAVAKSRITQLLVRFDALSKAAQIYYLANGQYPSDVRDLDLGIESSDVTYGKTTISNANHIGIIYDGDAAGIRCAVLARGDVWCTDEEYAIHSYLTTGKRYCRNRTGSKLAGEVCRSIAVGDAEESTTSYKDYPLN